jgi:hypothetical protein
MPSDNTTFAPHIPDAVRRASLRADELAREAGVANVEAPPGSTLPELPENVRGTLVIGESPAPPPESTTVVTEPFQPEPPTPPPEPTPSVDWEQRYATLQGKYNNEIAEFKGQVNSLRDLIAAMQNAPPAQVLPPNQPGHAPAREIPTEDVEAYGQDLITASQRWAEAKFVPIIEELKNRVATLEGGHQQIQHDTVTGRVNLALTREVPNWETINFEPGFNIWLAETDDFSGQTRKQMLNDAYARGDARRTVAFFRAYQREHTEVRPQAGTQPLQTPIPVGAESLPLAELAVPGRGQTAPPAPGATDHKRTWTGAQVTALYREKQRGLWNGREAEFERLERDVVAAGVEGRLRQ